jgi:hypothetical protein
VGARVVAIVLEQRELAVGELAEPVLASIEMPEVEAPVRRPSDAAGPEAAQGHAVVGSIVQVAGVAHRVRAIPAEPKGSLPARLLEINGPTLMV